MKVSYNWLKNYVPLEVSPQELEAVLPMMGLEVEATRVIGIPQMDKLVVGEVLSREQHPNADKLGVCQVAVGGEEPQQIVCGASNYKVGDRVPVALPGCKLPGDFKIKKSKLRGVTSNGMLCSAKELGLGEDHAGLLILTDRPAIGTPMNEVFKDSDVIFELELTANRGDCMSHIGVARELAAYYNLPLHLPEVNARAPVTTAPTAENLFLKAVSIETEECALYTAWTIQGVKIGPSPDWLQKALEAVDLRPINNIVDATNYVLLETGQPLHAFDAQKIAGQTIRVRSAAEGETITTLDDKNHTLGERMMVIADATKPLVIAGIMGSVDAEVDAATADIVLESAWFRPGSVRWTSRRLNLHTDSSNRFTRDVDPAGVEYAAKRAIDLIIETAGGQLIGPCVRVGAAPRGDRTIAITPDYVRKVCGFPIADAVIKNTFERLGFAVVDDGEEWTVTVGSFRPEVDRPIDLVEEFIRLYGTDKIPAAAVQAVSAYREDDPLAVFNRELSEYFVGQHFFECCHYSLTDGDTIDTWQGEGLAHALRLDNPLTSDMSHFRASLLPGLLNAVKLNLHNGSEVSRLYEMGRVLRMDETGEVYELIAVGLLLVQASKARSWLQRGNQDFYTIKAHAEKLLVLAGLSATALTAIPDASKVWESGHAACMGDWLQQGFHLEFGALKLSHLRAADVDRVLYGAELLIQPKLFAKRGKRVRFQPFSSFPPVAKDLALVVDATVLAQTVSDQMRAAALQAIDGQFILEAISVFDVYQGAGLPENKKSLAYTMVFRSDERTLKDKEVNAVFEAVQKAMTEQYGYEIRT